MSAPATPPDGCVLLGGMQCDETLWEHQVERVSELTAVLTPRLQGATIEEMALQVLVAAPPVFDLVGLSLGGIVAMRIAALAGHRVRRLALLSTTARAPRPAQYQQWSAIEEAVSSGSAAEGVAATLWPHLVHPANSSDPILKERVLAMAGAVGEAGLLEQVAAQRSRRDERPMLGRISCSTAVICGEDDRLCPVELHEEIVSLIPDSTLTVIDMAGHLAPLERPVPVTDAILRWLTTPAPAAQVLR